MRKKQTPEKIAALNELLRLRGSLWQIESDGSQLTRSVDTTATAAFHQATTRVRPGAGSMWVLSTASRPAASNMLSKPNIASQRRNAG